MNVEILITLIFPITAEMSKGNSKIKTQRFLRYTVFHVFPQLQTYNILYGMLF